MARASLPVCRTPSSSVQSFRCWRTAPSDYTDGKSGTFLVTGCWAFCVHLIVIPVQGNRACSCSPAGCTPLPPLFPSCFNYSDIILPSPWLHFERVPVFFSYWLTTYFSQGSKLILSVMSCLCLSFLSSMTLIKYVYFNVLRERLTGSPGRDLGQFQPQLT